MIGAFDDAALPLKVILLFVADGGWHLQAVLLRNDDGYVSYLPPYSEPWSDRGSIDDWRYLAERILEGRGGNAYTYEVEGFAPTVDEDIESVVNARAAEVVASSGGPLGEVAMTVSFGAVRDGCTGAADAATTRPAGSSARDVLSSSRTAGTAPGHTR